jgi:hypothetical protein
MGSDELGYKELVQQALRGVMCDVLKKVSEEGLPGDHHFYITFRTDFPGVILPPALKQQYPEEMTIALQHQYWGLETVKDCFSVTLAFNRIRQRLTIPYAAVSAFMDPAAEFGLQFKPVVEQPPAKGSAAEAESQGNVVSMARFRKKDTPKGPTKRR